ncbi:hypothetical protein D3C73_1105740 [compost metagenome]
MTPFSGALTLIPKPASLASTCASNASLLSPALAVICINGCFSAVLRIWRPALILSAPSALIAADKFTSVTPPPATIPSASAALVAATASSTRNFFSSISVSVAPPTLITATLPDSDATRLSNCSLSYSLLACSDCELICSILD